MAAGALTTSDGEVTLAILIAAGAKSLADAADLPGVTDKNVRRAPSRLSAQTPG